MKKTLCLILAFVLVLSCMVQVSAADKVYIYVSTNGSDENPGTFSKPVASLSKACELAKDGNAVINVMGGEYKASDTAFIESNNITIKNYNNEKVVISGAETIDPKLFKKVTDEEVLNRVVEKSARKNLVCLDMKEAGITELGAVSMAGFGYPESPSAPLLVINKTTQTLARYPDDDYMYISSVVKNHEDVYDTGVAANKGVNFIIAADDARISKWGKAEDPFIFGYFRHDWADATLSCKIDADKKTFETEYPSLFGVTENRRFYCFNLLEEISKPGEWYLNRQTGVLYLYPEDELDTKASVEFVYYSKPFITIDGAENVTVEGISFTKGLDKGISITNSRNVKVTDCNFESISKTVINITDSYDCNTSYCNFKEVGGMAFYIRCGIEDTLTPGNCVVENCVIDGFQKIYPTGNPGIYLLGVGNRVSHNVIRDGANIAIWFQGNNNIIEYNDISEVCTDTADAGAIYAGCHWEDRGNEIRYNYIHDMGIIDTTTGMKVQAVYLDDGFSSAKVYGNIIKDVPSTALYGGGRYNTFENNVIIGGREPFVFDDRYMTWDNTRIMGYLKETPYDSEIWKTAYPELTGILDDEPNVPKHNIIRNNVSVNAPGYNLADLVKEHAIEIKPDFEANTDIFVDYRGGDLTLKEDCEVFTKLPDFKPIDFKAIGVQEKAEDKAKTADDVLAQSVVLKLNTPTTYVFGNKTPVDPDNAAVMPQIINDRTLVPVRFIAESLGGEVTWDDATKKVGIVLGDKTIELVLGDTKLSVNGQASTLDVPAQSIEGRTMLPLRAVTESLGMKVFWDNRGLIVVSGADILTSEDTALINEIISMF